jgi:hypothetical protein
MIELLHNPKIKPEHLARKAIVYLRQSSEKQVRQNKESQLLQYAVAERVRALGWKQVEIINSDLGSSAGLASAQREGFERVLSLVALGEVGIVGSPGGLAAIPHGQRLVSAAGGLSDLWNAYR